MNPEPSVGRARNPPSKRLPRRCSADVLNVILPASPGEVESGSGALECELQLQAQLPGRPWATLWACSAVFTDQPARAQRLQGLATQQRQLNARQAELQGRLDDRSAVCRLANRSPPWTLTAMVLIGGIMYWVQAHPSLFCTFDDGAKAAQSWHAGRGMCKVGTWPCLGCACKLQAHDEHRPGKARNGNCGRPTRRSRPRSGLWAGRRWWARPRWRAACGSCRRLPTAAARRAAVLAMESNSWLQ